MRMEFIDDGQMRIQTVQRRALRRLCLKRAPGARHVESIRKHLKAEALPKRQIHLGHALRVPEDDLRLIARRRKGIHLGAGLVIRHKAIERYAARQTTFPVSARDLKVDAPKPPAVLSAPPTECRRQDEHLPGLKIDALTGEFPFRMGQEFNKAAHS